MLAQPPSGSLRAWLNRRPYRAVSPIRSEGLHKRYCRLAATRKDQRKIITALGRELLGFIWAIGIKAETAARQRIAA